MRGDEFEGPPYRETCVGDRKLARSEGVGSLGIMTWEQPFIEDKLSLGEGCNSYSENRRTKHWVAEGTGR